jgi:predicted glycosyltransferase
MRKLRIIIDILHPAHVHFFRNFIKKMEKEGHKILVTVRSKEIAVDLLKQYKIPYIMLSKQKKGIGLLKEFISRTYKLYRISKKFKPDCYMGIMGPSISVVGKLLRKPCYVFYDTEHAKITNIFAFRLATKVITPDCYMDNIGKKHVKYSGYHELAYLHPDLFKPKAIKGIKKGKTYVLRFVSWAASHDIGHKGLSLALKRYIVKLLSEKGNLIITSESKLPKEFEKYRLSLPPNKIHDLLYYSDLYIGEGATMASEAAVLGTSAIYINTLPLGYINDQQRNGLVKYFDPRKENVDRKIIDYLHFLLSQKDLKKHSQKLRNKLLKNKVNVTDWMLRFIKHEMK